MISERWVYQKRNVSKPWALLLTLDLDKRHPERATLACRFYREDIRAKGQTFSVDLGHRNRPADYALRICEELEGFCDVEASDYSQVLSAVDDFAFRPLETLFNWA